MSEWKRIKDEEPPEGQNVLFAFTEHWNQVVGFRSGKEYWETSAHDLNHKFDKPYPEWWAEVLEVPHRRS